MKTLILALALLAPHAAHAQNRIVTFREGTSPAKKKWILESLGVTVKRDFDAVGAALIEMPWGQMDVTLQALAASAEVAAVEPDVVRKWIEALPPVDFAMPDLQQPEVAEIPPFLEEAAVETGEGEVPWGVERVKAPRAWSKATGMGVKVAVIDTGIDLEHPDLDVAGGVNLIAEDASPQDDHGHGTHVAGTIGAKANGIGVVGVAPDAQLYAVKVMDDKGRGPLSAIIAGLDWAVKNKMHVANMSLGGPSPSPAMAAAVKRAEEAGVVVVAAAGNSGGEVGYPAAYPETIAVAASDQEDAVAGFSSRGEAVDVIAPGVGILSTYPGSRLRELSGTSMAAPHVSGLVALCVELKGRMTSAQAKAQLKRSATPIAHNPVLEGDGLVDGGRLIGETRFAVAMR